VSKGKEDDRRKTGKIREGVRGRKVSQNIDP